MAPQYNLTIQVQIPAALCALHNFIRIHTSNEETDTVNSDNGEDGGGDEDYPDTSGFNQDVNFAEGGDVKKWRDEIAAAMWSDYQRVLVDRTGESDDGSDETDAESGGEDEQ